MITKHNKDDLWIMAQTCYGEARGESLEGIYAVAHVIRNRAIKKDVSPSVVCLQKAQFSCWLAKDPNRKVIEMVSLDDKLFSMCLRVVIDVLSGTVLSNVGTATHYCNPSVVSPAWAQGKTPVIVIGRHAFYKGIAW